MYLLIRGFVVVCLLSVAVAAQSFFLRNDLVNLKASRVINDIGEELLQKTNLFAYVIATNEHFPQGFDLVRYTHETYGSKLKKPYVVLLFAPFATIRDDIEARGRFGLVASSPAVRKMYDYDEVRDAAVGIVATKDSNKLEDKVAIGVVQGYSVLADNIAAYKGVKLSKTIPNETGSFLWVLRVLIYSGSLVVLWFFVIMPILRKWRR